MRNTIVGPGTDTAGGASGLKKCAARKSERNVSFLTRGASALALCLGATCGHAADGDSLNVTLGVKEWVTDWTTWRVNDAFFGTGRIQINESLNSASRLTSTPQIGLRYGNFIASASYLYPQSYSLSGSLDSLSATRREVDANLGYYILPGVALTAGYKEIHQDYGGGVFKWKGPTVGVTGAAPLGNSNWAIYGLYGYGVMRLTVPEASKDAFNDTTFDANYSLAEAGLAYVVPLSHVLSAVRFTVSYRAQILNTRGYKLRYLNGYTSPNERDFTQGPAFGISGTF